MTRISINVNKPVKDVYVKAGDIVILDKVDLEGNTFMVVKKVNGKYTLLNMETGLITMSSQYTQNEITSVCKDMAKFGGLNRFKGLMEEENWFRKDTTQITISELTE